MSRQNADNLHLLIRRLVERFSGHVIGEQSDQELTALMLSVFKAHAVNINEELAPRDILIKHVRHEILRLNTLVAQSIVPSIVNSVEQHLSFLQAVDKPRSDASLALPINTNNKGSKML
jgi:hypothetical protein